jgi:hypothetical protein
MKLKSNLLPLAGMMFLIAMTTIYAGQKAQERPVPKNFSYPESSETIVLAASTRSLSGIVKSPGGDALQDVLVEQVDLNWGNRLAATFTDSGGRFALSNLPEGKYYLKLSKSGFCTLRVKALLKKRAKPQLHLELPLGI